MPKLQRRAVSRPDDVRENPHGKVDVFDMGDFLVSRHENRPGWGWSYDVKPRAGTDLCTFHHHGYTVSRRLHVETTDGAEMQIGPGDIDCAHRGTHELKGLEGKRAVYQALPGTQTA